MARGPMGFRGRIADWVTGIGRIIGTTLNGDRKAVVAAVVGIEDRDDPDDYEYSASPFFQSLGLISRPRPYVPTENATGLDAAGNCEVAFIRLQDELFPVAYRDLRLNARVNPREGEVLLAGYAGGFLSLADGPNLQSTQVTLYAPKLNGDGSIDKAFAMFIDPDGGGMGFIHGDGAALLFTNDNVVLKNHAGDGFVSLDADVFKMSSKTAYYMAGVHVMYAPNATQTKAHLMCLDIGDNTVTLAHSSGAAILIDESGALTLKSPSGAVSIILTDQSITMVGPVVVVGTVGVTNSLTVPPALPVLQGVPPGAPSLLMKVSA